MTSVVVFTTTEPATPAVPPPEPPTAMRSRSLDCVAAMVEARAARLDVRRPPATCASTTLPADDDDRGAPTPAEPPPIARFPAASRRQLAAWRVTLTAPSACTSLPAPTWARDLAGRPALVEDEDDDRAGDRDRVEAHAARDREEEPVLDGAGVDRRPSRRPGRRRESPMEAPNVRSWRRRR